MMQRNCNIRDLGKMWGIILPTFIQSLLIKMVCKGYEMSLPCLVASKTLRLFFWKQMEGKMPVEVILVLLNNFYEGCLCDSLLGAFSSHTLSMNPGILWWVGEGRKESWGLKGNAAAISCFLTEGEINTSFLITFVKGWFIQ